MRICVRVITRAKKTKVEPYSGGIKVHLNEPALEGRANRRLIEMLAQYYKVSKSGVSIVQGLKQKNKIVAIDEVDR